MRRRLAAIASSKLSMSTGDEAGTAGGGVVSNRIKGALTWIRNSTDVKFEGKGVVRFLDDNLHNGNASNTNGKDLGKAAIPGHEGDIVCDNCGKSIANHPQLQQTAASREAAQNVKGRTVSAVVVQCPKQKPAVFSGVAADQTAALTPNTFVKLAKNFKYGTTIPPGGDGERTPAGNCAEQKALYAAHAAGMFPTGPGCQASMSAMREVRGKKEKAHVAACRTCQRVLTSMMCTDKPQKAKGGGK